MLFGWMGVSPELRVEVTFLMTFSSVNPVKIGDGHDMEAVEQAGEQLVCPCTVGTHEHEETCGITLESLKECLRAVGTAV